MEKCSKYSFVTEEKWNIYIAALNTYTFLWCSLLLLNVDLDSVFYQTICHAPNQSSPVMITTYKEMLICNFHRQMTD